MTFKYLMLYICSMKTNSNKIKFRIITKDNTILNAGTDKDSWFTLDKARKIVDYKKEQKIIEHDGVNILWEIF